MINNQFFQYIIAIFNLNIIMFENKKLDSYNAKYYWNYVQTLEEPE